MTRASASVVTLVLLLSAACQSRAKSMQALCDLPKACPECIEHFEAGDLSMYQDYLRRNASHPDVGRMLEDAAAAEASERIHVLRRWVATEGIEDCAFADWLGRPIVVRQR